jgi:D-alanyl-D-alanine carboxypeptidase (penicillin-binding protein 5/6)
MKNILLFGILFVLLTNISASAQGISAEYACVMEPITRSVCFEKNARTKAPMASTTKIMTALIAIELNTLNDVVTVSANAAKQEGSSIYLRAGNKILMSDLLYGLMLNSGNDAAVAVAEHIGGSVPSFVALMNEKAAQIGANDTHFENPNGLNAPEHYTTAYDLALITSYALENPEFCKIVSTKTASATLQNETSVLYFKNHNKLLNMYPNAIGVKTGFTKTAGRCLVSAAEKDGMRLVCTTLKAPDDWNDHKTLLNSSFSKLERRTLVKRNDVLKEKNIGGRQICLLSGKDVTITVPRQSTCHTEISLNIPRELSAPLNYGEIIGKGTIILNDCEIGKIDIIAGEEVSVSNPDGFLSSYKRITEILFG